MSCLDVSALHIEFSTDHVRAQRSICTDALMPEITEIANSALHTRALIIIGAGGHATSVANVALSAGYRIRHFVDPHRRGHYLLDISVIGDMAELAEPVRYDYCIAVGDNAAREQIHNRLVADHPDVMFPVLIHASATISCFTEIGAGTVVMPHAVIGPNTSIGKFCILNTRASIDHDSRMADYSSLAPGVVTGGTVCVGTRSAVSIGATVKHGVSIGDDCVIGANSYLNRDLSACHVAYGTPARIIRVRNVGDPYLD